MTAGCLKNGCGYKDILVSTKTTTTGAIAWKHERTLVPAPGDTDIVDEYMGTFGWMFGVSISLVILMSFLGDLINTRMRLNAARSIQKRLLAVPPPNPCHSFLVLAVPSLLVPLSILPAALC